MFRYIIYSSNLEKRVRFKYEKLLIVRVPGHMLSALWITLFTNSTLATLII